MKDREAFELKWVMIAYNLANVVLSAFFFYKAMAATRGGIDTYGCGDVRDEVR